METEWDPGRASAARERWADSPQWAEYTERPANRAPEEWHGIASLFTAEPDFAASYDPTEPGLTAWMQEVINAHALARGVNPATPVWG